VVGGGFAMNNNGFNAHVANNNISSILKVWVFNLFYNRFEIIWSKISIKPLQKKKYTR
jgi:hypothetical protein